MSYEIRRVPADWQHPTRDGNYVPLFEDFKGTFWEWYGGLHAWLAGEHKSQQNPSWFEDIEGFDRVSLEPTPRAYSEWSGASPDPEAYVPDWPEGTRTHYQIYETVSEGIPVSPVFPSKEAMVDWLVAVGIGGGGPGWLKPERMSREAAEQFAEVGFVPSAISYPDGTIKYGMEVLEP